MKTSRYDPDLDSALPRQRQQQQKMLDVDQRKLRHASDPPPYNKNQSASQHSLHRTRAGSIYNELGEDTGEVMNYDATMASAPIRNHDPTQFHTCQNAEIRIGGHCFNILDPTKPALWGRPTESPVINARMVEMAEGARSTLTGHRH